MQDDIDSKPGNVNGPVCLELAEGISLKLLPVQGGTFTMGSPEHEIGRDDDERKHRVTLTEDYWLGETPVTQAQWQAVMADNPSEFKGDDLPVEKVTWYEVMDFCRRLNELTDGKRPDGCIYSLPTEAQWEYACRAGTAGAYNVDGVPLDELGWFRDNSGYTTHPVKSKRPNARGFYDMHGNVYEWCADWHEKYNGDDTVDPTGPSSAPRNRWRVNRGGGYGSKDLSCRSACRNVNVPGYYRNNLGFRIALIPEHYGIPAGI